MFKRAIVLLGASLMLLATPVLAENLTPKDEFLRVQTMIQTDFDKASAANTALENGTPGALDDLVQSLHDFRDDLLAVNVDDCFAIWWADYMASLQLMVAAMDDASTTGAFSEQDSALVTAAAALVTQGRSDLATVTCIQQTTPSGDLG